MGFETTSQRRFQSDLRKIAKLIWILAGSLNKTLKSGLTIQFMHQQKKKCSDVTVGSASSSSSAAFQKKIPITGISVQSLPLPVPSCSASLGSDTLTSFQQVEASSNLRPLMRPISAITGLSPVAAADRSSALRLI